MPVTILMGKRHGTKPLKMDSTAMKVQAAWRRDQASAKGQHLRPVTSDSPLIGCCGLACLREDCANRETSRCGEACYKFGNYKPGGPQSCRTNLSKGDV
jgi:hypothetical protein